MALSIDDAVGQRAPAFTATGIDGQTYDLEALRQRGPVLAGFFKETCPTCMLAWPFVERLHAAYKDKGLQVVGLSQGDAKVTNEWQDKFRTTHALAVDDGLRATVAYGLDAVPSLFLIDRDGAIRETQVGWSVEGFEALSHAIADLLDTDAVKLMKPTDEVPAAQGG